MNHDKFDLLIRKYQDDQLSEVEKELMDEWFDSLSSSGGHNWTELEIDELRKKIVVAIDSHGSNKTVKTRWLSKWIPYAAAILLVATLGGVYQQYSRTDKAMPAASSMNNPTDQTDILPGGNRATLRLSDGTVVELSDAYAGIIVDDKGISYTQGESLLYQIKHLGVAEMPLAELVVPRGGQYQVVLPDGSKVWLNSASVLKYPLRFDGSQRAVDLEGEAYFEVASRQDANGRKIPFRVFTSGQKIDVLGTTFNVSAYSDDAATTTTLISGQVRVVSPDSRRFVMLEAGQQAVSVGRGEIEKSLANTNAAVAWKAGIFHFSETPFPQMLKQIARWYDVDVSYQGTPPNELFSGKMNRNVNLGVLVKFLKDSGINLHVEGNTIIVEK